MSRCKVSFLRLARGRPVAGAVVGRAQMRTALDHAARGLSWEHFDLVLRQRDYFLTGPQALFGFMRSAALRERSSELGGYNIGGIGEVRLVN